MSDYLPCVEIGPEKADSAIIWLHGLGADGNDFAPIVPQLQLPAGLAPRFLFPHAPAIPVTVNQGYVMPAWFDILSLDERHELNVHQLLASAAAVHALIDRELERGLASERVLLAGFSQGGAVNFQAALTYDKPLGGLLALSTWFPTAEAIEPHPANAGLPILICHGDRDPVIPLQLAELSRDKLRGLGFRPEYRVYDMEHQVCAPEVADIGEWMGRLLGRAESGTSLG